MANIKFSQFTVGNTESDIDFVVGYKGANNIQISPANLLSATLTGYLPLTGGTMSGNIVFTDNVQAQFGTGNDLRLVHNGSDSYIQQTGVGDLIVQQTVTDADISFQADNGSGGITEYFKLDGNIANGTYVYTVFADNSRLTLGNGTDLRLWHSGTQSYIQNYTGQLNISANAPDEDIRFYADDGSGSITEYFRLDGGLATGGTVYTVFSDNSRVTFGNGYDLQIYHDASNSYIKQGAGGHLIIQQETNDGDIAFKSDDGSGGIATYMTIDGGVEMTTFSKDTRHNDSVKGRFGSGGDLYIEHDGTDSKIINTNGDLSIQNQADDKDIVFKCDDGSGGITTYITIDGSTTQTKFEKNTKHLDSVKAIFGASNDLQIYSDGSNSYINNFIGELNIWQNANDKDIVFASDNGSGGIIEYLRLDGSDERLTVNAPFGMLFFDNIKAKFGAGSDLQIFHDGHSRIENNTGDLVIQTNLDDGDIKFRADDGSGGVTEYFRLDGGLEKMISSKHIMWLDNKKAQFGDSNDLQIYHDSTNSYIDNINNHLVIQNQSANKDIIFKCDDGSGGLITYFQLDGSSEKIVFTKSSASIDNAKATFGNNDDLQIYHDGSNSYITDAGTGNLNIQGDNLLLKRGDGSQTYLQALTGSSVSLYHAGNKKLETKSTGINISGVSEYADNAAAIAGGLTTGDVYRTGDLLKIVH